MKNISRNFSMIWWENAETFGGWNTQKIVDLHPLITQIDSKRFFFFSTCLVKTIIT